MDGRDMENEGGMEGESYWKKENGAPRWSSFNQNYKGLAQEQVDICGGMDEGMEGWRDGGGVTDDSVTM